MRARPTSNKHASERTLPLTLLDADPLGRSGMLLGFFTRIGCHYDPYSLGECTDYQALPLPV